MPCIPISDTVSAIAGVDNLIGYFNNCPVAIANGPAGYAVRSTGAGLEWVKTHPPANLVQEAAPFSWNATTQCGVIPNVATLVDNGNGAYTFTPGDGTAATTFNTALTETTFAATSANAHLTVTAGGTNGHAPRFNYDLAGDIADQGVGAALVPGVDRVLGADGQLHLMPTTAETANTYTSASPALVVSATGTASRTLAIDLDLTQLPFAGACVAPAAGVRLVGSDEQLYDPSALRGDEFMHVEQSVLNGILTNVPVTAETTYDAGNYTVSNRSCYDMALVVMIQPMSSIQFTKNALAVSNTSGVFAYAQIDGNGFTAVPVAGHYLQEATGGGVADTLFTNKVLTYNVPPGGSVVVDWEFRYEVFGGAIPEIRLRSFPILIWGIASDRTYGT